MLAQSAALLRLTDQIKAARNARTVVDIRGGGTKAFYGGAPCGDALELRELSGITSYEPTELVITALAGTPLSELEALLASRGQCLAFEPPRYAAGGTVGGMVAAGLSGPARFGAGALRDYVLGVSLLNGAGELLTFGGQVMKNVAGYDVSRVLAGSMGILGILCEISLKVMPLPAASVTCCFDLDQAAALDCLHRWAALPYALNATSWHQERLLVRVSGARAALANLRKQPGSTELEPHVADAWWNDVRDQQHSFFDLGAEFEHGQCLWRLAVPDTTPPLSLAGEQFMEWGGAQRWLRSRGPAADIRATTAAAGGHATLFRAVDKSAGAFTALSQVTMAIHRRLKQAFDPDRIFNPGRLYAEL